MEKFTVTLPLIIGFPQSSTTVTSIAVGQPAVDVKPVPSSVKTGISLLGGQVDTWGCSSEWAAAGLTPEGKTSNSTSIWKICGGAVDVVAAGGTMVTINSPM